MTDLLPSLPKAFSNVPITGVWAEFWVPISVLDELNLPNPLNSQHAGILLAEVKAARFLVETRPWAFVAADTMKQTLKVPER